MKILKIDLSDIAGTPGARGRYPISERLDPTEEFAGVGPVTGEITVENTGSLLLVRGRLQATLRCSCKRCLGQFDRALAVEVGEEFATESTDRDIETVDRDEPEAAAISHYVLDVSDLVRQQIAVNAPMAPICRSDCRGLCPQCGGNLNEGPCDCGPQPPDSRWEKLRDLFGDVSETEQ